MGTGPDRRQSNCKRPLGQLEAMSPKRFRQEVEAGPATSAVVESPGFVPMIKRIRRLESDCSAQKARVAELEELVFELRKEVFGVVHGSAGINGGERVLRVDTSNTASAGPSTSASGSADGIGGRNLPIRVEDDEDSLYSSSPPPRPTLKMPHPIRNLPPTHDTLPIPNRPHGIFPYSLLQTFLGGQSISDGYYEVNRKGPQFYPVKSWYALHRDREPYAPPAPGHHGAKLSLFMQWRPEGVDAPPFSSPLFISQGGGGYAYYGNYREPRASDRLDYSRMVDEVPFSVKQYWARVLTASRPHWATGVLVEGGLVKKEVVTLGNGSLDEDLADELADGISADQVLKAFEAPDADEDEPSMRLYWEYLECVGWDNRLYDALVVEKEKRG
ncbi:MAG: hypothetical protein M1839_000336 [Geoglossum umbratile]|nr:MAG: hypothetical protein M1839_000336 [Geoglossum umbratile]